MYSLQEDINRFWHRELVFDAERAKGAIKIAVALLIGVMVGMAFQLPKYNWLLITVVMLSMPNVGSSAEKAALRMLGTVVGAVLGLWLVAGLMQTHVLFTVVLFVIFLGASYYGSRNVYPYAFFVGGLTTMLVAVDAVSNPESVIFAAAWRGTEVLFGVIVSTLVALFLWPVFAHETVEKKLEGIASFCSGLIHEIRRALFEGRPVGDSWRTGAVSCADEIVKSYGLLRFAGMETPRFRYTQNELINLTSRFEGLISDLDSARRACKPGLSEGLHRLVEPELQRLFDVLEPRLERMGRELAEGLKASSMAPVEEAWNAARTKINELRSQGRQYDYPLTVSTAVHTVLLMMDRVVNSMVEIERDIIQFHQVNEQLETIRPRGDNHIRALWGRLFVFDQPTFRVSLITALLITTVFVVFQTNVLVVGGTWCIALIMVSKMSGMYVTARLAWVLGIGFATGVLVSFVTIIWVYPGMQGVLPMLIWNGLVFLVFSYFAVGNPAYSPGGSIAVLIYVSIATTDYAPPADAITALHTAIGWSLAMVTILIPGALFWPAQVTPERRRIAADLWELFAKRLRLYQLPDPQLPDPTEVALRRYRVLVQFSRAQELCLSASLAGEESPQHNAVASSVIRLTCNLFFKIEAFEHSLRLLHSGSGHPEFDAAFNAYMRAMADACDELARTTRANQETVITDLGPARVAMDEEIDKLNERRRTKRELFSFEEVGPLLAVVEQAQQVEEGVRICAKARLEYYRNIQEPTVERDLALSPGVVS